MSNIVGINDLRNNDHQGRTPLARISDRGFFSVNINSIPDPRKESFFSMLLINVCPYTHWDSFSVIYSIVIMIIFTIQIAVDGLDFNQIYTTFLPINTKGPMTSNLILDWPSIADDKQFWRFFTALFIHANINQLLGSIVSFLIWTSFFERLLTTAKMPQNFFLTGMVGNLIGLTFLGKMGMICGSIHGIFGIYGSVLGYLIYNWQNMEEESEERFLWFLQLIVIVMLSFFMGGYGDLMVINFSGFLAGFIIGLFFSRNHPSVHVRTVGTSTYELVIVVVGIILTIATIVGCLVKICVFGK